jgi:hypothetical protein
MKVQQRDMLHMQHMQVKPRQQPLQAAHSQCANQSLQ